MRRYSSPDLRRAKTAAIAASKTLIVVAVVVIVAIAAVAAVVLIGNNGGNANPKITVTAPSTGGSYQAGSSMTITWTSAGDVGANVKIEAGSNGVISDTIVASTPNSGSYQTTIPSSTEAGTTYFVRITSLTNATIHGDSGTFTITAAPVSYVGTITVTSPAASSVHEQGSNLAIAWTTTGNTGDHVKIELVRGTLVTQVAASTQNNGSFSYSIPNSAVANDSYLVRITSLANSSIIGSSGHFSITEVETPTAAFTPSNPSAGNYTFTVASISPSDVAKTSVAITVTPSVGAGHVSAWTGGGSDLAAGVYFTVGWMKPGYVYSVRVSYVPNNGTIWSTIVTTSGGAPLQIGQYVNYSVSVTLVNLTGTHVGTGFSLLTITALNSTNVTYTITSHYNFDGVWENQTYVDVYDRSGGFGGFDMNSPPYGLTYTANGTEYVSTPWGLKPCLKIDITGGHTEGSYWLYGHVLIKMHIVVSILGYGTNITYTLSDTNIPSITS
ncbi:MAG TPA: Ser-Thr-rich GPI-anchored membrane family protein [Methanomassiliicoccales archaeon]|nr:Ser-Thr-rich GPI-anchored membrane family protein [Methanomassiliicoccales archaeon]